MKSWKNNSLWECFKDYTRKFRIFYLQPQCLRKDILFIHGLNPLQSSTDKMMFENVSTNGQIFKTPLLTSSIIINLGYFRAFAIILYGSGGVLYVVGILVSIALNKPRSLAIVVPCLLLERESIAWIWINLIYTLQRENKFQFSFSPPCKLASSFVGRAKSLRLFDICDRFYTHPPPLLPNINMCPIQILANVNI